MFLVSLVGFILGLFAENQSNTNRVKYISMYYAFVLTFYVVIIINLAINMVFIPEVYKNFCDVYNCNNASSTALAIQILSIIVGIIWIIILSFYVDLIARILIISGRFYKIYSQLPPMQRNIHKIGYRFHSIHRTCKTWYEKQIGIRFDDIVYCPCFCNHPRREGPNYISWEPTNSSNMTDYRTKYVCCRGCKINCFSNSGNTRRSSYDYSGGTQIDLTCGIACDPSCCKPISDGCICMESVCINTQYIPGTQYINI